MVIEKKWISKKGTQVLPMEKNGLANVKRHSPARCRRHGFEGRRKSLSMVSMVRACQRKKASGRGIQS